MLPGLPMQFVATHVSATRVRAPSAESRGRRGGGNPARGGRLACIADDGVVPLPPPVGSTRAPHVWAVLEPSAREWGPQPTVVSEYAPCDHARASPNRVPMSHRRRRLKLVRHVGNFPDADDPNLPVPIWEHRHIREPGDCEETAFLRTSVGIMNSVQRGPGIEGGELQRVAAEEGGGRASPKPDERRPSSEVVTTC